MSMELSEMNFQDDLEEVLGMVDAARWVIVNPVSLEIWVVMHSTSMLQEEFQVRLLWDKYPDVPSMKFRDQDTGRLDMSSAWPQIPGFRPKTHDACVNWCKEGFDLHPEWLKDPKFCWDNRGNVMLKVLRILQQELDDNYNGRAA